MYGKQHILPFKISENVATIAGEIIHADVCGPMEVASVGGARYFLLLKDDYSHFRTIFFLKNKSEAKYKIKNFLRLSENITGKKTKILRTDNGLEEVNKEVKEYLEDQGIRHQRTCRYTPQQNGRAERENRTIVESARSMLNSKNLKKELWAEAVNTACYVLNRSGTSSIKGKTPYELWYNKMPDLRFLKLFGSDAFVYVPKPCRKKLDPKSKKGIFVGYEENTKGYRIYYQNERKVEISRNVIFKPNFENELVNVDVQENGFEYQSDLNEECTKNLEDNSSQIDSVITNEDGEKNEMNVDEKEDESLETDKNDKSITYNLRNRDNLKMPAKYSDFETSLICCSPLEEDLTFKDAIEGPNCKQWKEAIEREFEALERNNTWTEVTLPVNKPVISSKWVFRLKTNNGEPTEYKARLVARGFQQKDNFDLSEVYAPVAKLTSIRIMLAVANQFNYSIHQMDVKGAFLYSTMKEEVYMYPPEGLNLPENRVLKLNKSLYGLKKSPRYWNEKFNTFMLKEGFVRSKADYCLYSKSKTDIKIYVLLFVDDLLIVGNNKLEIMKFKGNLSENFEMKDLGKVSNYLGLHINQKEDCIEIDQSAYLAKVLHRFGMADCKPASTPLDQNLKISDKPSNDKYLETRCRQLIGSLMYAVIGSRPDLCAAVSILSRYQCAANEDLWISLKRILRYIKGTLHMKLIFRRCEDHQVMNGFVDSDWAGDTKDRKSTSGYLFRVFGCTVSWSSKKQPTVSLSSTEAEYMALSMATSEACWIKSVLKDMGVILTKPIQMLEDNQSAIKVAKNPEQHKRLKHVDIRHHFIREKVESGFIDIKYVTSEEQMADVLTKGLGKLKFEKHRLAMGLEKDI